jgi:hypothetical protein
MKILKYSGIFVAVMQTEAFIFSNKAFSYYDNIKLKGGFSSKEEIEEFHRNFNHIGYYPFTIIPSIYYGMNYLHFENGIPKIYTKPQYIEDMEKIVIDGVEKYCK